jgi:hypothetical protein
MAAVDPALLVAVRELTLETPGLGVKKMVASVKGRDIQCGTKEVRAALACIKAEKAETSSPPVSPSASPAEKNAEAEAIAPKKESARQAKVRAQKEKALEEKARSRRKTKAFKKLFPELDLNLCFGKFVDRREQKKALDELKQKLTDREYLAKAIASDALGPEEIMELVQDMKSGNFVPSSLSDEEEEDASKAQVAEASVADSDDGGEAPSAEAAGGLVLPSFGAQATLGLPSFGGQARS